MGETNVDLVSLSAGPSGQTHGQWVGRYTGSNEGLMVLDLDLHDGTLRGTAHAFDDNQQLPTTIAFLEAVGADCNFEGEVPVIPVGPGGKFLENADLAKIFPGVQAPTKAAAKSTRTDIGLHFRWETDIGTSGEGLLSQSDSQKASLYKPADGPMDWSEFKGFVLRSSSQEHIYRGQPAAWRLRTSFHRTCRADVFRFSSQDIPALHRSLSARTNHYFDLRDPVQNGAFYNLVQHHGYPTPLLDWTYSPYVAAFFAFRSVSQMSSMSDVVRVFMFDKGKWVSRFNQLQQVAHVRPHFSVLESASVGNERLVPQQALTTLTNVDDLETYLRGRESYVGEFLQVIDIHASERHRALTELALMGITAGSMFPGLDGACQELKAKLFGY